VGAEPRQLHNFCDLLDHARHHYKPFGQLQLNNFLNILAELKTIVARNTENRPEKKKKTSTPVQGKPVNRPRKRRADTRDTTGAAVVEPAGGGARTIIQRNSSAVLVTTDQTGLNNSTAV